MEDIGSYSLMKWNGICGYESRIFRLFVSIEGYSSIDSAWKEIMRHGTMIDFDIYIFDHAVKRGQGKQSILCLHRI